jgi:hypothetical protein
MLAGMPLDLKSFDFGNLIAGIIFSGIGFVAFTYGKKAGQFKIMGMGGLLMVYPYFTPSTLLTCLVGAILTGSLYFIRED